VVSGKLGCVTAAVLPVLPVGVLVVPVGVPVDVPVGVPAAGDVPTAVPAVVLEEGVAD